MKECHCTGIVKRLNRHWSIVCLILSLLSLSTGVVLGMGLSI